jgi:hypothetical protein
MTSLNSGCIVRFEIIDRNFTEEGLAMGGIIDKDNNKLQVYQKINLENFPSFRDFEGKSSIVKHGNYGMILKKIGRPDRINHDPNGFHEYDVYEVLTDNLAIRQLFRYNLTKVL